MERARLRGSSEADVIIDRLLLNCARWRHHRAQKYLSYLLYTYAHTYKRICICIYNIHVCVTVYVYIREDEGGTW